MYIVQGEKYRSTKVFFGTGKSLSEALLFAENGENMFSTKIVPNVRNNLCTQHVFPRFELGIFMYGTYNSMNNLSSSNKVGILSTFILHQNLYKIVYSTFQFQFRPTNPGDIHGSSWFRFLIIWVPDDTVMIP